MIGLSHKSEAAFFYCNNIKQNIKSVKLIYKKFTDTIMLIYQINLKRKVSGLKIEKIDKQKNSEKGLL